MNITRWKAVSVALLLLGAFVLFFQTTISAPLRGTTTSQEPIVTLLPYASGLDNPIGIANAGDERLFIIERVGRIKIIHPGGIVQSVPYLDIQDRVRGTNFDEGILGLVFHPNYAENGYFYVHYTGLKGEIVISRFQVSSENPDLADPSSEFPILIISEAGLTHRGGMLAFGPDGYLYLSIGDGESPGTLHENAQNLNLLLGKILRIDVDGNTPYAIPSDNPFASDGDPNTRAEIWAYGLRNPWRFTFDALTGDIYIGDVGEFDWEEVDFQPANSGGGENYGWACYEGTHATGNATCPSKLQFVPPIFEYSQKPACAIIGGYVYRGNFAPFQGHYFFTDLCTGAIQSLHQNKGGDWQLQVWTNLPGLIVSFGEGNHGDLYVADITTNTIYRLQFQSFTVLPLINKP